MKTLITSLALSTLAATTFAQAPQTSPAAPRPPAVISRPPAANSLPPAVNSPPPTVNTPPPSGATPPPAGATPPPSGATPPPIPNPNTPPPGTAIQPPAIGNNQNIQPGLNQSHQMPTNSGFGPNGRNMFNNGYAPGGINNLPMATNTLPRWRTNYFPGRGYPTNLPVRPSGQGQ